MKQRKRSLCGALLFHRLTLPRQLRIWRYRQFSLYYASFIQDTGACKKIDRVLFRVFFKAPHLCRGRFTQLLRKRHGILIREKLLIFRKRDITGSFMEMQESSGNCLIQSTSTMLKRFLDSFLSMD